MARPGAHHPGGDRRLRELHGLSPAQPLPRLGPQRPGGALHLRLGYFSLLDRGAGERPASGLRLEGPLSQLRDKDHLRRGTHDGAPQGLPGHALSPPGRTAPGGPPGGDLERHRRRPGVPPRRMSGGHGRPRHGASGSFRHRSGDLQLSPELFGVRGGPTRGGARQRHLRGRGALRHGVGHRRSAAVL